MKKLILAFVLFATAAWGQQPDAVNGCVYSSALPTLANGQRAQMQCDSSGRLFISTGYGASGVTPITGSFTGTANSAAFTPIAGREFNASIKGTWTGTIYLARVFSGDAQLYPITAAGIQLYTWTGSSGLSGVISEQAIETETGVTYVLVAVVTSGTATYRISQ